jgi:hypothetical protein
MHFRGDPIFLLSGVLLGTTITLFVAGVTPYPYRWIVIKPGVSGSSGARMGVRIANFGPSEPLVPPPSLFSRLLR